jgi:hypothetical protein
MTRQPLRNRHIPTAGGSRSFALQNFSERACPDSTAATEARALSQIDQRSVDLFLGRKALSETAVLRELLEILGPDAIAHSMVRKSLRSSSFEVKGAGSDEGPRDPGINFTDDQRIHKFERYPFASVRQFARMTLFAKHAVSVLYGIARLCEQEIALVFPSLSEEHE